MAVKTLTRDNLVVGVLVVMLAVLSWTTVLSMRSAERNGEILNTVQRCVLPEGDLCKGNPDQTKALLDDLVRRINSHTDEVVGR